MGLTDALRRWMLRATAGEAERLRGAAPRPLTIIRV